MNQNYGRGRFVVGLTRPGYSGGTPVLLLNGGNGSCGEKKNF